MTMAMYLSIGAVCGVLWLWLTPRDPYMSWLSELVLVGFLWPMFAMMCLFGVLTNPVAAWDVARKRLKRPRRKSRAELEDEIAYLRSLLEPAPNAPYRKTEEVDYERPPSHSC